MSAPVRTRIAPAPSGYIHVGNARAALYNWLFARQHDGVFVLRIEDTDQKRVAPDAYEGVMADLRWLGLDWDEGPGTDGELGPYIQSQRTHRYQAVSGSFLDRGDAYPCYCTPEELEQRRKAAQAEKRPPGYDGRCRDLSDDERARFEAEGRSFAIRFKVPRGRTIVFEDLVRGEISTSSDTIPDFVITRSDGSPTYMLAASVDDALMNITHVIRGEDLISATPRQMLVREAMGVADMPEWGHLPLLVDERGRPLSKRWGDVSVTAYRERGFLPEAMVNYLSLLGWSYDDKTTVFSLDELVEKFSIRRVARNPATFDVAKLEWLNGHYIRTKPAGDLAAALVPVLEAAGLPAGTEEGRRVLTAVTPLISERMKRLDEAVGMVAFLFGAVKPDEKASAQIAANAEYLEAVADALQSIEKWTAPAIEEALRALAAARDLKPKQAFQPIRAAVTGTLVSPPLFESLEILGRDATLERLRSARGA